MAEQAGNAARPAGPVGRALFGIARILAILGGVLSCAMAVIVTISVAGRYLFSLPIPGDYDLVGILCGCAIFAFLPYCQLHRGNVFADFFTQSATPRTKAALDTMGNVLFLGAAIMFTWRLYYGALEMRQTGEQIAAFTFYRWWTMPFDIFCAIILIFAIAYTLTQDAASVKAGASAAGPTARGE
jgi:TRAP-type C4-dicarboxylate transport system permease small subunit